MLYILMLIFQIQVLVKAYQNTPYYPLLDSISQSIRSYVNLALATLDLQHQTWSRSIAIIESPLQDLIIKSTRSHIYPDLATRDLQHCIQSRSIAITENTLEHYTDLLIAGLLMLVSQEEHIALLDLNLFLLYRIKLV